LQTCLLRLRLQLHKAILEPFNDGQLENGAAPSSIARGDRLLVPTSSHWVPMCHPCDPCDARSWSSISRQSVLHWCGPQKLKAPEAPKARRFSMSICVNMCQYQMQMNANDMKNTDIWWYMMIYDDQQWSVDRIISTCKISTFAILWYFMIFENVCFTSGRLWYKVMKRLLPPLQQTPERSERLPRNFAQTALGTPWNILERLGTSWTGSIQTTKLALRIT